MHKNELKMEQYKYFCFASVIYFTPYRVHSLLRNININIQQARRGQYKHVKSFHTLVILFTPSRLLWSDLMLLSRSQTLKAPRITLGCRNVITVWVGQTQYLPDTYLYYAKRVGILHNWLACMHLILDGITCRVDPFRDTCISVTVTLWPLHLRLYMLTRKDVNWYTCIQISQTIWTHSFVNYLFDYIRVCGGTFYVPFGSNSITRYTSFQLLYNYWEKLICFYPMTARYISLNFDYEHGNPLIHKTHYLLLDH